jgi:hypothetical protein
MRLKVLEISTACLSLVTDVSPFVTVLAQSKGATEVTPKVLNEEDNTDDDEPQNGLNDIDIEIHVNSESDVFHR